MPRKFRSNIAQGRGGERALSVFSFSGVKKLARWNDVASFDAPSIFSWELFKKSVDVNVSTGHPPNATSSILTRNVIYFTIRRL